MSRSSQHDYYHPMDDEAKQGVKILASPCAFSPALGFFAFPCVPFLFAHFSYFVFKVIVLMRQQLKANGPYLANSFLCSYSSKSVEQVIFPFSLERSSNSA